MTPTLAAARVCELAADARAAVVLDANGRLAGASADDQASARGLAKLAAELFQAVDRASPNGPPEQVEVQVDGGAVFLVRRPGWAVAAVARRSALASLMFYDLRAVMSELEAA